MKKSILLIAFMITLLSCGDNKDKQILSDNIKLSITDDLEKESFEVSKEGITYYKGIPFTGELLIYYENGQLADKQNYKDGLENGVFEYYHENGQLANKQNYKDGLENGVFEYYYENDGILDEIINYKDGKLDGFSTAYYENGQIKYSLHYKDGKPDGLSTGYYENGQIKYSLHNKDGDATYIIGDYYQGGVVFYLFEAGDTGYVAGETHGLIAAIADQSSGIQWCNGSIDGRYFKTGATGKAIGTGSANTDTLIALQGATETDYAAGLARAYTGGGYTDWFLPSEDELNQMFLKRDDIDFFAAAYGGSNFSQGFKDRYWSSTEFSDGFAYFQGFNYGYQYYGYTIIDYHVRAVRAF